MKAVSGNNSDTFFFSLTTQYQLPKLRDSTKLSPNREKPILSLLSQTLPLLYSPLLHQGLQSRAPGSVWLPGLLSSSASDCCGSAQRHAGSEGETKALKRKIRHKGTFSVRGLKQLKTQGSPGFTPPTASWWAPTPPLTESLCYREFNSLGDHGLNKNTAKSCTIFLAGCVTATFCFAERHRGKGPLEVSGPTSCSKNRLLRVLSG